MGILNVTPDSFFDGGRYRDAGAAVARAAEMAEQGAQIIDVGGESTRPSGSVYGEGAEVVDAAEELRRVLPVVERIATELPDVVISVDTYKSDVAEACLDAGAHLVNDVTGLRSDPTLADVVASHRAALIVMHSAGKPGAFTHEARHDRDVVDEVRGALERSVRQAEGAGIDSVVIDPGFGFGKTAEQNLRLLAATPSLLTLGRPVMVAVSRKSTVGKVLERGGQPAPVESRLYGSLGLTALAVSLGASIVRTHDIAETRETLAAVTAAMAAAPDLPRAWEVALEVSS